MGSIVVQFDNGRIFPQPRRGGPVRIGGGVRGHRWSCAKTFVGGTKTAARAME